MAFMVGVIWLQLANKHVAANECWFTGGPVTVYDASTEYSRPALARCLVFTVGLVRTL